MMFPYAVSDDQYLVRVIEDRIGNAYTYVLEPNNYKVAVDGRKPSYSVPIDPEDLPKDEANLCLGYHANRGKSLTFLTAKSTEAPQIRLYKDDPGENFVNFRGHRLINSIKELLTCLNTSPDRMFDHVDMYAVVKRYTLKSQKFGDIPALLLNAVIVSEPSLIGLYAKLSAQDPHSFFAPHWPTPEQPDSVVAGDAK